MLPRFHPLALAALTWLTLTQPVPGLAQGRTEVAPLPATAYLAIELACPTLGNGILRQVHRNVEDEQIPVWVTYESFVPVRVEGIIRRGADGAPYEAFSDDLRKVDWDKFHALTEGQRAIEAYDQGLSKTWNLEGLDPLFIVEDVEPQFNQVCSSGDAGIQRRYEEFLRRNRADLAAAPGTPLYNEPDPTLEP